MDSQDLKALQKLFALCRKNGIKSFNGEGVAFEMEALPVKAAANTKAPKPKKQTITLHTPEGPIETDSPTEEELLLWSVQDLTDSQHPGGEQ